MDTRAAGGQEFLLQCRHRIGRAGEQVPVDARVLAVDAFPRDDGFDQIARRRVALGDQARTLRPERILERRETLVGNGDVSGRVTGFARTDFTRLDDRDAHTVTRQQISGA